MNIMILDSIQKPNDIKKVNKEDYGELADEIREYIIYKIAQKYNTTVDEIKRLNNLTSNILSVGQVLKIPTTSSETPSSNTVDYISGGYGADI